MDNITYTVGDKLYINLTNRCNMDCAFCIRGRKEGVGSASTLWLEKEPTALEVIESAKSKGLQNFEEFVFCGFGEPTMRLDTLLEVCDGLKKAGCKIRLNTNGLASLEYGRDVTPELKGRLDIVSISLNAPTASEYAKVCRPKEGEKAFSAMLDFAKKSKQYVPEVILTVVDVLPEEKIEKCRALADSVGLPLRVRHFE